MAAGYMVTIANQSSGNATVNLASATDTIDGVTNTTNTLTTKQVKTYLVNAAGNGYVTYGAGEAQLTRTANTFYGGPSSGSPDVAGFRALVSADIPTPTMLTTQTATGAAFHTFTVPTTAKYIIVTFREASLTGTDNFLVQLGISGANVATGYTGVFSSIVNAGAVGSGTLSAGFVVGAGGAGASVSGQLTLTKHATSNVWTADGKFGNTGDSSQKFVAGFKALTGPITSIRIAAAGADTIDAGEYNVVYF